MSSLIPGFEYDIFISYRHKDNKYDGWVTDFVANLKKELEATFKEEVSVFFDENPHDGLLETHNVDKSLEGKLKCLILIPIVSQTYCDTRSFAWQHEFCAFNKMAKEDPFGRDIKLINGNVGSRILPIKIHDIDAVDKALLESELDGALRSVEFIYKSPGVNRPLRSNEEHPDNNINHTIYRDQINKVANAVKEIIVAIGNPTLTKPAPSFRAFEKKNFEQPDKKSKILVITGISLLLVALIFYGIFYFVLPQKTELPDKSIAVLPFENLSGDPGQEYFSDGIAEEILNALTQLEDLKVAGRTSSFQFKGKQADLLEIGSKLKVSNILEGSVRKQGNRVKITAQLISIKDGYHLWSEQYERTLNDVFAIQEEIATAITQKLKVTLLEDEKIEIRERRTENTEAYDSYLRGRYFWGSRELIESEKYFRKAIELDPSYAAAYAGLAEVYVLFPYFRVGPPLEFMVKAEEAAQKAIEIDSSLAIPYAVIAFNNSSYGWNSKKALTYFKKALRANPKYAPAHYWYGQYLCRYDSNPDLAISEMRKAVELEPLGSYAYFNLGIALTYAKRYDEALGALKTSTELNKQNEFAHLFTGHCYMGLGQLGKARTAYEMSAALSNQLAKAILIYFVMKEGKSEEAQELFNDMVRASLSSYVSPFSLALGASYLGQKDIAFDYIKKAIDMRDNWITDLDKYPAPYITDALLSDPRNNRLVKLTPSN
jgi:TolB-like protein/Tfp pilus assembly protein PilF